jgi:hypothetical protein
MRQFLEAHLPHAVKHQPHWLSPTLTHLRKFRSSEFLVATTRAQSSSATKMDKSNASSTSPSRSSTPNPTTASRFTCQVATAEDLLKEQTVGLVHLSDFRKRRAEALEQKERERQDTTISKSSTPGGSGTATPRNG